MTPAATEHVDLPIARRFLAIRHLLAPPRSLPPTTESVLAVVDRLGSLQFDPLDVAGRNHDLVLAARIRGYHRELADELLYERRVLFETYNKSLNLLPTRELPYYRISWDHGAAGRSGALVGEQEALAAKVLEAITREGPKSSTDFERQPAIDWWWGPTSAPRAVLEALAVSGRLGLARREGNRRYYDLVERLYPADLLAIRVPEREQLRHKLLSRFRAHGLLGHGGGGELWLDIGKQDIRSGLRSELVDRGELVAVAVDGLKGHRYVIAEELPLLAQARREVELEAAGGPSRPGDGTIGASFIAPLDPLLWDRGLLDPLYGFDYRWEVYTPAVKRRWGYYVLPILFGDRLVGRIEPRLNRGARSISILGIQWEEGFDPLATEGLLGAFAGALRDYMAFGDADHLTPPPDRRHRPLFTLLAAELPVKRRSGKGPARSGTAATPRSRAAKPSVSKAGISSPST